MTRVKKGINALKTRKNILRKVKGFRYGRSTKERQANEAIVHAGTYAFEHRKDRKGDFRRLWNVRLSAALKENGISYSKFIPLLKKANILLDRKILAEIALKQPDILKKILETVSQSKAQK
ncbi:MAG: 50S ribosomal protein L20 [Candidatus Zambryskibacteria bacterium RIFCSPHIGHO2_02_FULL_43_14]|uniref:Large ribosomal subunit protein bL20 n=1 Tax=Candidatus Zambryskibacteria bacterium RIFCSPHIGHO2_02_FULL_43_14 TaxID=1802748 RepID=A0A1G2TFF4_9BACT|nr:MAG: 50S ribosomal protein L20 [Candidatus Zambryskibacteria bacterium RIFCSPHIGHO2_01_FULL_43_60]OHA96017.1 MAG: 50S ribosomal protein L20 [Candidatus Zambryskibacteria bacterium RIFCSPHIGHO2_02_FULL_43_14]OHB03096.1 MAG: 50S ribosomal protein L20 [Candidatus Zambryskibacteria bacterium RIFCSPLOWO2_01_FULL_42_41]